MISWDVTRPRGGGKAAQAHGGAEIGSMETKANYVLNAVLILLVLAALVDFVHWFHTGSVTGTRATYNIIFRGSVGGLAKGGEVEFNGMRVGDVVDLRLDARDPKQVLVTVSIDSNVPIRTDTYVALRFGTVAGVAWIEFRGGDAQASPLPEGPDGIPVIIASESATQGTAGAARDLGRKVDELVGDDSALHKSLANFEAFTAMLKSKSDRFDHVTAGLESLAGTAGKPGELTDAVKSIRLLSENLGKRVDAISPGIEHFTGPGLKNIDALILDARHVVSTAEKVFKDIGDNPSRVIFGGAPAPQQQPAPAPAQQPATAR
jgi:phospholipid/cholesterol/gamma-HCH transport system substrate-binding protein